VVRRIDNSLVAVQGDAAGELEIMVPEGTM
jgi:hypothetical protein